MKKNIILVACLLMFYSMSAQKSTASKINELGETHIFCYSPNTLFKEMTRVLVNPKKKTIQKIQSQHNYLGYNVVITGVLAF